MFHQDTKRLIVWRDQIRSDLFTSDFYILMFQGWRLDLQNRVGRFDSYRICWALLSSIRLIDLLFFVPLVYWKRHWSSKPERNVRFVYGTRDLCAGLIFIGFGRVVPILFCTLVFCPNSLSEQAHGYGPCKTCSTHVWGSVIVVTTPDAHYAEGVPHALLCKADPGKAWKLIALGLPSQRQRRMRARSLESDAFDQ